MKNIFLMMMVLWAGKALSETAPVTVVNENVQEDDDQADVVVAPNPLWGFGAGVLAGSAFSGGYGGGNNVSVNNWRGGYHGGGHQGGAHRGHHGGGGHRHGGAHQGGGHRGHHGGGHHRR